MPRRKPLDPAAEVAERIRLQEAILKTGRVLFHSGVGAENLHYHVAGGQVVVSFPVAPQGSKALFVGRLVGKGPTELLALVDLLRSMTQELCDRAATHLRAAMEVQVSTGWRVIRAPTVKRLFRLAEKL